MKKMLLIFGLMLFVQSHYACKKEKVSSPDSASAVKRVYANQRFQIELNEKIEVIDTTRVEKNPNTGLLDYPVYVVFFDSLIKDNRAFGELCSSTFGGMVFTQVTLSKWGNYVTDTFYYQQCYRLDYLTLPIFPYINLDGDTLYHYRTHPLPLSGTMEKANENYSLELILKN